MQFCEGGFGAGVVNKESNRPSSLTAEVLCNLLEINRLLWSTVVWIFFSDIVAENVIRGVDAPPGITLAVTQAGRDTVVPIVLFL